MSTDDPSWQVDLFVEGPVAVQRRFSTVQQKGFQVGNPFYSDVEITSAPGGGLRVTLTARAADEQLARGAAMFFFGRMLDLLSLAVNVPIELSFAKNPRPQDRTRHGQRRIIEPHEIEEAFNEVQHHVHNSPSFLKATGWYRKGLHTDDPINSFLAYWNAIEILAAKYYHYIPDLDMDRAKLGAKNQLWACFLHVWGPCESWPLIPGDDNWIDNSYAIRNDIAHGGTAVDISRISEIAPEVPLMHNVAHRFLVDARSSLLSLDRHPPQEVVTDGNYNPL